MPYAISLKNISKIYEEPGEKPIEALKNIDLEIERGEFFIILGPSGSGKSTLLRAMSGLDKHFSGDMKFGDGLGRGNISFVFQQFALMPWLSVYKNIELALIARNIEPKERKTRTEEVIRQIGLAKFEHARPKDLSGGMRQRVGIARALVTEPEIIFLDEAFSELDSFTAAELRKLILEIWEKKRMTVVMVTHLVEEAVQLGDRIAVLTERPGRIEKIIRNHLARPRHLRSTEFFAMEDELYRLVKP